VQHLEVLGVLAAEEDGARPAGDPAGHEHRLGARGGAVVHAGVGDVEAGELGDDGLELEDRLQRALRHLGLVRRVRGVELGALQEHVDGGRDGVRVQPAPRNESGPDVPAESGRGGAFLGRQLVQVRAQGRLVEGRGRSSGRRSRMRSGISAARALERGDPATPSMRATSASVCGM
jgi:hypothetical protein